MYVLIVFLGAYATGISSQLIEYKNLDKCQYAQRVLLEEIKKDSPRAAYFVACIPK